MADQDFSFVVTVDGMCHTITADTQFVQALNSDDPLTKHYAYEYVASFLKQKNDRPTESGRKPLPEKEPLPLPEKEPLPLQEKEPIPLQEKEPLQEKRNLDCTRSQSLLLIELYKQNLDKFQNPSVKKKTSWEEITKEFNSKGYNYTNKQVEGRWKTLVSAYRRVKDHNKSTGKQRKIFEFEEALDDILAERHDTTPTFTMASFGGTSSSSAASSPASTSSSLPISSLANTDLQAEEGDDSDSGEPPKKKGVGALKRKRQSSAVQITQYLKEYEKHEGDREKARLELANKMHNEKVSLFKSLFDLMKKQQ